MSTLDTATKYDTINLQKTLMFIRINHQLHLSLLPWDIAKILQTYYFGYDEHDWPCPPKMIVSTCMEIWYLSASKKSNSSLFFFFRYFKDIANLLFWVLSACLSTANKNDGIILQKTLMIIFIQKIKFITHLFFKILLRYCKLVILGTLDMPHHPYFLPGVF